MKFRCSSVKNWISHVAIKKPERKISKCPWFGLSLLSYYFFFVLQFIFTPKSLDRKTKVSSTNTSTSQRPNQIKWHPNFVRWGLRLMAEKNKVQDCGVSCTYRFGSKKYRRTLQMSVVKNNSKLYHFCWNCLINYLQTFLLYLLLCVWFGIMSFSYAERRSDMRYFSNLLQRIIAAKIFK